jgi:hypothetical protein
MAAHSIVARINGAVFRFGETTNGQLAPEGRLCGAGPRQLSRARFAREVLSGTKTARDFEQTVGSDQTGFMFCASVPEAGCVLIHSSISDDRLVRRTARTPSARAPAS